MSTVTGAISFSDGSDTGISFKMVEVTGFAGAVRGVEDDDNTGDGS